MAPFRVLGIDHVVLRCSHPGAMEEFYCRGLGFEVAKRNERLGLVHLRSSTAMIDLVALDGPLGNAAAAAPGEASRNMDHLCLRVEPFDADALMRHFEALGAAPGELRTRFGAEGDGPSLYVRDPEGNRVEIKGPAS